MSTAWDGDGIDDWKAPNPVPISPLGWLRVVVRGCVIISVLGVGLMLLLFIRLFERRFFSQNRPITPLITQAVCRVSLVVLGFSYLRKGKLLAEPGAIVANHSSWLDIFALNAGGCLYFVSKAEVATWPGIGWLARATGTVFIKRNRHQAGEQVKVFQRRLSHGHKLLFFPEGTSSDGRRVLPFKATLFAAFFAPELKDRLQIQPVTVTYTSPKGQDSRFYGWWGDMDLAPHLVQVLAAPNQGHIRVEYHDTLQVKEFKNRKELAATCEGQVRGGLRL